MAFRGTQRNSGEFGAILEDLGHTMDMVLAAMVDFA